MSIFCIKKLDQPESVGTRLKNKREQTGEALGIFASRIGVAEKYLRALETSQWEQLPKTAAHRQAYLKKYAGALGLNQSTLWREFTKENGLSDIDASHPAQALKNIHFNSVATLARNITIAAVVITFAGYLVWQIRGILTPPLLLVYTPAEGTVTSHASIAVQGITNKESRLSITGKNIMIDEGGKFSTEIGLAPGVNSITVSALKKHGKTTTVTRHVIVKEKKIETP